MMLLAMPYPPKIRRYAVQYDMVSILQMPQITQGVSILHSPSAVMMTNITSWLDAIIDYHNLEDPQYVEWQEFILCKRSTVERICPSGGSID